MVRIKHTPNPTVKSILNHFSREKHHGLQEHHLTHRREKTKQNLSNTLTRIDDRYNNELFAIDNPHAHAQREALRGKGLHRSSYKRYKPHQVKGSAEAKQHMASLRAMRRK